MSLGMVSHFIALRQSFFVTGKTLSGKLSYVQTGLVVVVVELWFNVPVTIFQADQDGWMDDLGFYILFNSISVISGCCLRACRILVSLK